MVIMLDPVGLPVQVLSNITLIMLNSMVKNMSLWAGFTIFNVDRTLMRYRYIIHMPYPNVC